MSNYYLTSPVLGRVVVPVPGCGGPDGIQSRVLCPVDGGRGVPAEAEAGGLGGEPLDDVGHVGGGPGLSVLEENAADGIL